MVKEIFYAPERDSYEDPGEIYAISTEDIKHLAIYIIENIKPMPMSVTPAEGYITALTNYHEKDRTVDFPYKNIFEKIKYGRSSEFLYTNVVLALFEKEFRIEGIDKLSEKTLEAYNKHLKAYRKHLEHNNTMYSEYNREQNKIAKR